MSQKKVGIFLAVAAAAVIFLPSLVKLQQLRYKDRVLKDKIKLLQRSNHNLSEEKYRLENDTYYLEKVAREEMGVARQGEIIYKIVPKETGQQKAK